MWFYITYLFVLGDRMKKNIKDKKIDEVIELLFSEEKMSEKKCIEICNLLKEVYLDEDGNIDDNYRHSYSSISGKINELRNEKAQNNQRYRIEYVYLNNDYLYTYIDSKKIKYREKAYKLHDHIALELDRISSLDNIRTEIIQSSDDREKLRKQISDFDEATKKINKAYSDIYASYDKLKEKMEGLQKDYVSILGILSAVLITVTAGSIFSSSVLNNMHRSNIYKITFVCLILALVLFNAVSCMMLFIRWIILMDKSQLQVPKIIFIVNAILLGLIVLVFLSWGVDLKIIIRQITQSWFS